MLFVGAKGKTGFDLFCNTFQEHSSTSLRLPLKVLAPFDFCMIKTCPVIFRQKNFLELLNSGKKVEITNFLAIEEAGTNACKMLYITAGILGYVAACLVAKNSNCTNITLCSGE